MNTAKPEMIMHRCSVIQHELIPAIREQAGMLTPRLERLIHTNLMVPWPALMALIQPFAPLAGSKGGRPAFPVETMLRIHFLHKRVCC